MPQELRDRFRNTENIDLDVKETYKEIFAQGKKSKKVLEMSIEQHARMCVENSEDIFEARLLAKMLKEEIQYRIKQYSHCIMNNTQNYRDWLQEDYERRLRLRVSQLYASRL